MFKIIFQRSSTTVTRQILFSTPTFDVNDPSTYLTPPIPAERHSHPKDFLKYPFRSDAHEYVADQKIIVVNGDNVKCDGTTGMFYFNLLDDADDRSGHPAVYIDLADPSPQYCRYCYRPYIWEKFADQYIDDVKNAPRAEHSMPVGSYWNH